jgi:branched-chain amino acid transport system ATP-binding protein
LSIVYDHIPAVKQLDLTVKKGEIVALIGANGAGKTSTLRCISGIVKAKSGRIVYEGQEITNMEPHRIVKLGISHVPEGRGMFADLTVLDNLRIGAYLRKDRAEIRKDQEKMFRLFPRLEERKSQLAGTLSGGEQQMLAIARALMARPKLLLLDEPSMGLAPMLVQEIFKAIREINESGVSVLVVEQNTRMALALANRGYVLESGEVILQGTSSELKERLDPFTLQIR